MAGGGTHRRRDRQAGVQRGRQTDKQAGIQADRQTDGQTARLPDGQRKTHTHYACIYAYVGPLQAEDLTATAAGAGQDWDAGGKAYCLLAD